MRERCQIDVRSDGVAQRREVLGDPPLLLPVAIEVQPRPLETEWRGGDPRSSPAATSALARTAATHCSAAGQGSSAEIDGFLGFDRRGGGDRREVNEYVAEPRARGPPARPRA